MTMLQPELESFRHELRAAVEADLASPTRSPASSPASGCARHAGGAGRVGSQPRSRARSWKYAESCGRSDPRICSRRPHPAARFRVPCRGHDRCGVESGASTTSCGPPDPRIGSSSSATRRRGTDRRCPAMTPLPTRCTSGSTALRITRRSTRPPPSAPSSRQARRKSLVRQSSTGSPPTSCHCRVNLLAVGLPMRPMTWPRATTTRCSFRGPTVCRAGTVLRDRAVPDLRVPARDSRQSLPARSEGTTPRGDRGERKRSPRCWDLVRQRLI